MMRLAPNLISLFAIGLLAGCSTVTTNTATPATTPAPSNFTMEVTDIDYGSVQTSQRYLVSYSFPDSQGRFAVRSTSRNGVSEPVADTSDYQFVNDDIAASVICRDGLQKLGTKPNYLVADRAYQSAYICTNSEG